MSKRTYSGSVLLSAGIPLAKFTIPRMELTLSRHGGLRLNVEGKDGDDLLLEVFLDNVEDIANNLAFARTVANEVVDRLSFGFSSPISPAVVVENRLKMIPVVDPPGVHRLICETGTSVTRGQAARLVVRRVEATVSGLLDEKNPGRPELISLFASAMRMDRTVEKFLTLYHLLEMVVLKEGDSQEQTDVFVWREEPSASRCKTGIKRRDKKSGMLKETKKEESIYTCLRNQFAHPEGRKEPLEKIEEGMTQNLSGLARLLKRAIELAP